MENGFFEKSVNMEGRILLGRHHIRVATIDSMVKGPAVGQRPTPILKYFRKNVYKIIFI